MMSDATGSWEAPPRPDAARAVPVGRIVMVVVGALIVLVGGVAAFGGGILTWAHATQRDADGFFTTPTERLESVSHAIVSDEIDLGAAPGRRDRVVDLGDLATVRIRAASAGDAPVFVGIGRAVDVASYLEGVSRAEIDDVDFRPFRVRYRHVAGTATPAAPTAQDFWAASATGTGTQDLEWDLESGRWTVVIMNADGTPGVAVDLSVGAKADWVFPVGLGLLVGGLLFALLGAVLLVLGAVGIARHGRADDAPTTTTPAAPAARPVRVTGRLDEPLSRWLWLVKWILVIPHVLVLVVLWIAFAVLTVVAGFAILFTRRYPRGIFDFNVGVLRWSWRVAFYSFGVLGTDRYPPFTLGPLPDYPATFDVEYPEQLSRGLVLVKWWLLAIPHYIVVGIFGGGLVFGGSSLWFDQGPGVAFGGLVAVLVVVAGVVLLFTRRYPRGVFEFVMGMNRWTYRVIAYAALMRDEYPPFRLDQGGEEPTTVDAPARR